MALGRPGESTAEDTLRNADVAMYFAKDRGKGRVAVYDSALHETALRRLQVRSELGHAVRNGELVLHYQPVYELKSGQLEGFEALVRWQHPVRGLLYPDEFVEIAEQSDLIVPLGGWVLQEAGRVAAAELSAPGQRPMRAGNVSARQLAEPDFGEDVLSALATSGLEPARLVLEITETALVNDRPAAVEALDALCALGVQMAVDDFGTGYSSLSYLADLPVSILKIDRSFVSGIGHGGESLIKAIISLGDNLGLVTLAEGVQNPEQEAWLIGAGCRVGQGFLWSRPLTLSAARAVVLGRPVTPVAG